VHVPFLAGAIPAAVNGTASQCGVPGPVEAPLVPLAPAAPPEEVLPPAAAVLPPVAVLLLPPVPEELPPAPAALAVLPPVSLLTDGLLSSLQLTDASKQIATNTFSERNRIRETPVLAIYQAPYKDVGL
jgi:hypothetical protein